MSYTKAENGKGSKPKTKRAWKDKPAREPNPRENGFKKHEEVRDVHNDPAWYLAHDQLAKDVASFSFNTALGAPVTLSSDSIFANPFKVSMPGIMAIHTIPSIGVATSGVNANTAPINFAATALYSDVRKANSGSANYERADLMLYLLAMDSIYTYWSYLVRVYGICNHFNQENRYVGDALLKANGVHPDIRSELANFRAYINQYAIKAMSRYVPDVFTYFKRHAFMYQNVYKDEDVSKSQFYMYVPATVYKYSRDAETQAGMLTVTKGISTKIDNAPLTSRLGANYLLHLNNLRIIGDELLNSMVDDEDTAIISGDLIKAFGYEKRFNLPALDESYAVIPVFSEEMLAQFHNTSFAGAYPVKGSYEGGWKFDMTTFDVTQNPSIDRGELMYMPAFQRCSPITYSRMLDCWKQDPTPEWILVASRNLLTGEEFRDTDGNKAYYLRSCGSEVALYATIFVFNNGTLTPTDIFADDAMHVDLVSLYTKFNEAPSWYTSQNGSLNSVVGEIANFAVVSTQQIQDLHTAALLSMFNIR